MKYHAKICTFKKAIKFLMHARRIHRDYANNPTWCRGNIGSVEHHKLWVDRYTRIINLLKLHKPSVLFEKAKKEDEKN